MSDFSKYQALGNAYLVIDPSEVCFVATPAAVRLLCDRNFGIGADGILIGPLAPPSPGSPVELKIYNSDGSECEKSGNGLRMFALHAAERYSERWRAGEEFTLRVLAGESRVQIIDFAAGLVRVDMGTPSFDVAAVPLLDACNQRWQGSALGVELSVGGSRLTVSCLNLGNPHTVVVLQAVSRKLASELGPQIARHPRFPEGTNVQFLKVIDRSAIQIEVWERGAGYTLASGSSACAAACAARQLGLVDAEVDVQMPGGSLHVSLGDDGAVTMTGIAERVLDGAFAPAFRERLRAASSGACSE